MLCGFKQMTLASVRSPRRGAGGMALKRCPVCSCLFYVALAIVTPLQ